VLPLNSVLFIFFAFLEPVNSSLFISLTTTVVHFYFLPLSAVNCLPISKPALGYYVNLVFPM
jgi:hypothetical protein